MLANDPYLLPSDSATERKRKVAILGDQDTLWVSHTDGNEVFPGVSSP